jgi:hypothetical protein
MPDLQIHVRTDADAGPLDQYNRSLGTFNLSGRDLTETFRTGTRAGMDFEHMMIGLERGGMGGAMQAMRGFRGLIHVLGPEMAALAPVLGPVFAAWGVGMLIMRKQAADMHKEVIDALTDQTKRVEALHKVQEAAHKAEEERIKAVNEATKKLATDGMKMVETEAELVKQRFADMLTVIQQDLQAANELASAQQGFAAKAMEAEQATGQKTLDAKGLAIDQEEKLGRITAEQATKRRLDLEIEQEQFKAEYAARRIIVQAAFAEEEAGRKRASLLAVSAAKQQETEAMAGRATVAEGRVQAAQVERQAIERQQAELEQKIKETVEGARARLPYYDVQIAAAQKSFATYHDKKSEEDIGRLTREKEAAMQREVAELTFLRERQAQLTEAQKEATAKVDALGEAAAKAAKVFETVAEANAAVIGANKKEVETLDQVGKVHAATTEQELKAVAPSGAATNRNVAKQENVWTGRATAAGEQLSASEQRLAAMEEANMRRPGLSTDETRAALETARSQTADLRVAFQSMTNNVADFHTAFKSMTNKVADAHVALVRQADKTATRLDTNQQ